MPYIKRKKEFKIVNKTFTIKDKAGLHARPASILCSAAGKYSGDIDMIYKEKRYTLKSIIILMSLGVPQGGVITIEANGENEEAIIDELTNILKTHNLV